MQSIEKSGMCKLYRLGGGGSNNKKDKGHLAIFPAA